METQHSWKLRFSFKNATLIVCFLNFLTALYLVQGFLFPRHPQSVLVRYIRESEQARLAMQPLELIRRVREIQQEAIAEPEAAQHKETKQTAALDLSKRLINARTFSDATNLKALEEWRKRKMERARQRELVRNPTGAS